MTLLKYFDRIEPSKERIQSILPKPHGPLVHLIPCSTIESANSAIREFLPMPRALSMKPDSPNAKRLIIAIFYSCILYVIHAAIQLTS